MSGFSYWLRLRGLPFNSTPIDICRFLKDVRLEGGIDGVYFGVAANGKASGEAFVEVLTEEEVEKALIHHKALIGTRYIEVYASSEDEMWRKTLKGHKPGHFARLRGLPFGCLKEDIKAFFYGSYIRPRGITLLLDKQERCNGGAYIEFATKKGFEGALARHRGMMGDRYVEVFLSSEQELKSVIEKSKDGARGFSIMVGSGGGGGGGPGGGPGPGPGPGGRPGRNRPGEGPGRPGRRDREPREPFRGRMDQPNFPPFHDGQPPFMERGFPGPRGLRGLMPDDVPLPRQTIPIRELDRHMPEPLHVPVASAAPAAPEHRVHVRGMPPSGNASDLTKLFYPIAVMNVLLINDARGRPSGEADVFFNSHSEAVRSLEVNRQMGSYRLDFYLHSEPDRMQASVSQSLHGGAGNGLGSQGSFSHGGSAAYEALPPRYGESDRPRGGNAGFGGQYSAGAYGGGHAARAGFREDSGRMPASPSGFGYGGGRRY